MVVVGPPLSSSLSEDEDEESESEAANHFDISNQSERENKNYSITSCFLPTTGFKNLTKLRPKGMLQSGWKLTSGYGFEYKLVFNATYGVEEIEFKIWFSFTPHTGRTGKWLQEREKTPTTALPENRQKRKFHFHCQPKISSNQVTLIKQPQ